LKSLKEKIKMGDVEGGLDWIEEIKLR